MFDLMAVVVVNMMVVVPLTVLFGRRLVLLGRRLVLLGRLISLYGLEQVAPIIGRPIEMLLCDQNLYRTLHIPIVSVQHLLGVQVGSSGQLLLQSDQSLLLFPWLQDDWRRRFGFFLVLFTIPEKFALLYCLDFHNL